MAEKTEVQNKMGQYSMERIETNNDEKEESVTGNIELSTTDFDFDVEVNVMITELEISTN